MATNERLSTCRVSAKEQASTFGPAAPEPDPELLRSGFLRQVGCHPHNAALIIGDRVYTYAEAADIARRWASRLVCSREGRPQRVGVFAYRNETSFLGVLASLFAGAGFVPLNRKFPLERTRTMLIQADLDAIIVDNESLPQLMPLLPSLSRLPVILLPSSEERPDLGHRPGLVFNKSDLAETFPMATLPLAGANDLAYLLFTSGSTGIPNGVPITQANVRAFLEINRPRYNLTPEDRLTQTFDQTFDLSVFDLFMAWESGSCVCSMQPVELLSPFKFLEERHVTVWFSVPSVAGFMIKRGALTRIFHSRIEQSSGERVRRLDLTQPNENTHHRCFFDRL